MHDKSVPQRGALHKKFKIPPMEVGGYFKSFLSGLQRREIEIPSTAVGGLFRLASGDTEPLDAPDFPTLRLGRKELNHPPTAVGGI